MNGMSFRSVQLSSFSDEEIDTILPSFPLSWQKYWRSLRSAPEEIEAWVGVAERDRTLLGSVLATHLAWSDKAELRCFLLHDEAKNVEVGTALLDAVMQRLLQQRVELVTLEYSPSTFPDVALMEQVLDAHGWSLPFHLLTRYEFVAADFHPPWLGNLGEYSDPNLIEFPWVTLKEEERKRLERQERQGQFPYHISPFEREEILDPDLSIGLRYHEEIVGWLVLHRTSPDRLQYTSLYIDPRWQGRGEGLRLLDRVIRRQQEEKKRPYAFFEVYPSHVPKKWRHFIQKRISPWSSRTMSIFQRWKFLV